MDTQHDIERLSEKALIKLELFVESLLYDLDQLSQIQPLISTSDAVNSWGNTENDIQERLTTLADKQMKLAALGTNCKTAYEEMLNLPICCFDLRIFETQIYKKIENLKRAKITKDATTTENNLDFAQLLAKFLKQRSMVFEKHCTKYGKILETYHMIQDLLKRQAILKEEYEMCLTTVTKCQLRRQLHCWNLLRKSLQQENITGDKDVVEDMNSENCDINNMLENSKRLISENNVLWDQMSTLMKEL